MIHFIVRAFVLGLVIIPAFWLAEHWFEINPTWQEVMLVLIISAVVDFVMAFVDELR